MKRKTCCEQTRKNLCQNLFCRMTCRSLSRHLSLESSLSTDYIDFGQLGVPEALQKVESCFLFLQTSSKGCIFCSPLQALDTAMSRTEEHHLGLVPRDWPSSGWVWQPHTGDGSMWQGVMQYWKSQFLGEGHRVFSFCLWFQFEYLIWRSCESLLSCPLKRNPPRHNIQSQFWIDIAFLGRAGAESPAHRKLHHQGSETENRVLAGSSCTGKMGNREKAPHFSASKKGLSCGSGGATHWHHRCAPRIDACRTNWRLWALGTDSFWVWKNDSFFSVLRFYVVLFFWWSVEVDIFYFGTSQELMQNPFWQGGKTCNYRLLQATSIAMCEARNGPLVGYIGLKISLHHLVGLIPSQIRCH